MQLQGKPPEVVEVVVVVVVRADCAPVALV